MSIMANTGGYAPAPSQGGGGGGGASYALRVGPGGVVNRQPYWQGPLGPGRNLGGQLSWSNVGKVPGLNLGGQPSGPYAALRTQQSSSGGGGATAPPPPAPEPPTGDPQPFPIPEASPVEKPETRPISAGLAGLSQAAQDRGGGVVERSGPGPLSSEMGGRIYPRAGLELAARRRIY